METCRTLAQHPIYGEVTDMADAKFELLGAGLYQERVEDAVESLRAVGRLFPLTDRHRQMLLECGGAIFLHNGALFEPIEPNPLVGKNDGCNDLTMLFGLGEGRHSILGNAERTDGE